MTLGEFLADKRMGLGLSFREAQKLTGVSHTVIFQIESEIIKKPSFLVVVKLCRGYKISIPALLKKVTL